VNQALIAIFEQEYRALRPRAPMPEFAIRFRKFVSLNTSIRLREGNLHVSLSDLLEGAPEGIHHAIAHILLAKLYRKPQDKTLAQRYKRFSNSEAVVRQSELVRQARGRKKISGPEGHTFDLNQIFDSLNRRFFYGLLGRPQLTWSESVARRALGHFDPAHNTIVISRVFDRPGTPLYAVEYLLYHEMLHLKHPVKRNGTRRCVHSRAFQTEERLFPYWTEAMAYLKRL
jgi:hypothetical protein